MCTLKAVAPDPSPGIASSMAGWVGPGCFISVFTHIKWADILHTHTQLARCGVKEQSVRPGELSSLAAEAAKDQQADNLCKGSEPFMLLGCGC